MRAEGLIKSVNGDMCTAAVVRKTACGDGCAHCSGCAEKGVRLCEAKNTVGAAPGDRVIIESGDAAVLRNAFLVYILPILVMICVFAAVNTRFGEAVSAACSFAALAAVYAVLHKSDKRLGDECMPEVTGIIN